MRAFEFNLKDGHNSDANAKTQQAKAPHTKHIIRV
jgi:hypothetical protein